MWFYWYWYEHVILGVATMFIMYYIKFYLLDGEDILLSLIKYIKGKK